MVQIPNYISKQLNELVYDLSKEIEIIALILYGSYANGTWTKDSDIDIAVFSDSFTKMDPIEAIAYLLNKTIKFEVDIQPISFNRLDYINSNLNPFVENILQNGIYLFPSYNENNKNRYIDK